MSPAKLLILSELRICNQMVVGSIPTTGSNRIDSSRSAECGSFAFGPQVDFCGPVDVPRQEIAASPFQFFQLHENVSICSVTLAKTCKVLKRNCNPAVIVKLNEESKNVNC